MDIISHSKYYEQKLNELQAGSVAEFDVPFTEQIVGSIITGLYSKDLQPSEFQPEIFLDLLRASHFMGIDCITEALGNLVPHVVRCTPFVQNLYSYLLSDSADKALTRFIYSKLSTEAANVLTLGAITNDNHIKVSVLLFYGLWYFVRYVLICCVV